MTGSPPMVHGSRSTIVPRVPCTTTAFVSSTRTPVRRLAVMPDAYVALATVHSSTPVGPSVPTACSSTGSATATPVAACTTAAVMVTG
ncbi:hypothetical protein [Curtobacterium sp. MCPF17_052]|uniref:hypothetical protein n=1 Tax=Curtobacterium sp. MCPF17_052 TaxID=2175655 RepID=UPI0024DFB03A|nr:hypothetical protein [Curtobacterium sp. MCPF17_052]WIB13133.1 hypothetical protein DEJ36_04255 [Curtobacterium sp. MCPF17_052]